MSLVCMHALFVPLLSQGDVDTCWWLQPEVTKSECFGKDLSYITLWYVH